MKGTLILDGREYEVDMVMPTIEAARADFKATLSDEGEIHGIGWSCSPLGILAQAVPFKIEPWDGFTRWPSAWIRRPRPSATSALAYIEALS